MRQHEGEDLQERTFGNGSTSGPYENGVSVLHSREERLNQFLTLNIPEEEKERLDLPSRWTIPEERRSGSTICSSWISPEEKGSGSTINEASADDPFQRGISLTGKITILLCTLVPP